MSFITTQDAAEELGVTIARVQQMIWEGKLPAQKVGRDYIIAAADLDKVRERKRGRPPTKTTVTTVKQKSSATRSKSKARVNGRK
jgi:excisionase family DNA binding protein